MMMKTRTGRCGEWANCFTFLCRALDFDARFIMDTTDHVWTEVWSQTQNRWLHLDACENLCDKPLIYEHGWKKQISYVLAFSKDEVTDVTWRYTSDFTATRNRRRECSEKKLAELIQHLTNQKQSRYSKEKRKELAERQLKEHEPTNKPTCIRAFDNKLYLETNYQT